MRGWGIGAVLIPGHNAVKSDSSPVKRLPLRDKPRDPELEKRLDLITITRFREG